MGNGWSHTFRRQITGGFPSGTLITGSGQTITYTGPRVGGAFMTPAAGSGVVNKLFAQTGYSAYTETQPDGTAFNYSGQTASTPGQFLTITNPAGAIATLTYSGPALAIRSLTHWAGS